MKNTVGNMNGPWAATLKVALVLGPLAAGWVVTEFRSLRIEMMEQRQAITAIDSGNWTQRDHQRFVEGLEPRLQAIGASLARIESLLEALR